MCKGIEGEIVRYSGEIKRSFVGEGGSWVGFGKGSVGYGLGKGVWILLRVYYDLKILEREIYFRRGIGFYF